MAGVMISVRKLDESEIGLMVLVLEKGTLSISLLYKIFLNISTMLCVNTSICWISICRYMYIYVDIWHNPDDNNHHHDVGSNWKGSATSKSDDVSCLVRQRHVLVSLFIIILVILVILVSVIFITVIIRDMCLWIIIITNTIMFIALYGMVSKGFCGICP